VRLHRGPIFFNSPATSPRFGGVLPDLAVDGQNLLYEIHHVSDWVLTLDRNLGIEYFDSPTREGQSDAPGILLDFSPDYPGADQSVMMLTTRLNEEIEHLVAPSLLRLGLEGPGCGHRIVEWLRSLSGRLAMRLIAAPVASQGIVGMALARAFLGEVDLLHDSVIIPVDAHVQLWEKGIPDDDVKSRTDLILARRVGLTRQLELALIEVKCSAGQLTTSAYHALVGEMEAQIASTQGALTVLFDPTVKNPDRLDRPLRNRTLARLLHFYIGRARRYGLLRPEAESEFLQLIGTLDEGYSLTFRQVGIIFDLSREDDHTDDTGDVTVHRVGRASCERLLRGEKPPKSTQITWDRVRQTLRGTETWTRRPQSDHRHGDDEQITKPETATTELTTQLDSKPEPAKNPHGGSSPVDTEEQTTPEPTHRGELNPELVDKLEPIPTCRYLVGDSRFTPQWGILGRLGSDQVALDLNGCNTLSLFGVQGGGKSYTMGTILEMAIRPLPGLNVLPRPLAGVVFHYNESQDYAPEFVSMAHPNSVEAEVARLRDGYCGEPAALHDILILAPADKVSARQSEFPGVKIEPIAFHPSELTIQDWRFLMGAVGNDSLYIRELNLIMRSLRDNITVAGLEQAIDSSSLTDQGRRLARLRLRFAEQFVRDGDRIRDKLLPGRLIIVDFRDELVDTDEALGLFVVMLRVFAGATYQGQSFSKWIAFDEAHKYIRNPDLVDSVVQVIRQMRHQATSVLIASQDPPSLPVKIVELSSMVILHRMDSPNWLKHIQKAVTALGDLTAPALARLRPGEAYLWARAATDPIFTQRAVKVQLRPCATQHGGATKSATDL